MCRLSKGGRELRGSPSVVKAEEREREIERERERGERVGGREERQREHERTSSFGRGVYLHCRPGALSVCVQCVNETQDAKHYLLKASAHRNSVNFDDNSSHNEDKRGVYRPIEGWKRARGIPRVR